MDLSNSIKSRFIKDYSLPIQLFRDDYFDYFINLYDNMFNTKDKLLLLENCLEHYGSEESYFASAGKLRDDVISGIKGTSSYSTFISMDMKPFELPNSNFSKGDIFKENNNGKSFISIDLVKANYQVMSVLNSNLVLQTKNYNELLEKFTDNPFLLDYFKGSKYLRQVIFGNLNPNRQVTVQKYCTNKILKWLLDGGIVKQENVRIFTYDEIVIESDEPIKDLSDKIYNGVKLLTKAEFFTLEHRKEPISYYIKHLENDLIEFRTVPIVYFAQVYKSYHNLPLTDYDYRFIYEDRVAQFLV